MALLPGQVKLELDTLYEVEQMTVNNFAGGGAKIWINSGSVDIKGSDSTTQPANLAAMTLNSVNTGVAAHAPFEPIPRYIAIVQNDTTSTEINISGIRIVSDLGAIS